jgi:hypothetical protein
MAILERPANHHRHNNLNPNMGKLGCLRCCGSNWPSLSLWLLDRRVGSATPIAKKKSQSVRRSTKNAGSVRRG